MTISNSNKFFSSLLILVLRLTISVAADDTSDNPQSICGANLKEILPPPYSDLSSITCSPVWQQRFAFRFFQDTKNVTTIVVSGKHDNRWVGIGFSYDGKMVGSSAVVGWVGRDGVSAIKQYSLEGKNISQVIPDKGALQFTNASPVVVLHQDTLYMGFQIKFSSSVALQPILMAIGDGNPVKGDFLPKHINRTSTFIEFSSGHLSGPATDANDMRRYHGFAAIVGWGIMTPAGGIFARYFRHVEPGWYYLHSSTQFIGFFIGIIAISLGRNLYLQLNAVFTIHKFIGFSVFFLCGLEVCQFIGRPSSKSKFRKYWNFAHYWVGRTAIVFGVVNIFVGFHGVAADFGLKVIFVTAFAMLLIAVVILERRLREQRLIAESEERPVFQVIEKNLGK